MDPPGRSTLRCCAEDKYRRSLEVEQLRVRRLGFHWPETGMRGKRISVLSLTPFIFSSHFSAHISPRTTGQQVRICQCFVRANLKASPLQSHDYTTSITRIQEVECSLVVFHYFKVAQKFVPSHADQRRSHISNDPAYKT